MKMSLTALQFITLLQLDALPEMTQNAHMLEVDFPLLENLLALGYLERIDGVLAASFPEICVYFRITESGRKAISEHREELRERYGNGGKLELAIDFLQAQITETFGPVAARMEKERHA